MYYTYNKLYKEINDAMNAKYTKTQKKEKIGRQLLKDSQLLNEWFPNHTNLRWVEDEDTQLSGVDYFLTSQHNNEVAIDLKVGVGGDYHRIVIEYDQWTEMYGEWRRTFTKDKRTDFLVFCNLSMNDEKIDFVIVNYRWVVQEIDRLEKNEKTIFDQTIPKDSFNGTGHYFTIDLEKCYQSRQMVVKSFNFKDLTKPGRKTKNPLEDLLEEL